MEPQFDTVFGRAKDDLDDALQRMKEVAEKLNRGPGGRELAIAITNAETARLWLNQASESAAVEN